MKKNDKDIQMALKMCAFRNWDRKTMLDRGDILRIAALGHRCDCGSYRIKVIFRGQGNGTERAFFMSRETYDAIPLLVNAAPHHFRYFGEIQEAESSDIYKNK